MKFAVRNYLAVLSLIAWVGMLSSCGTLARMGTVEASQDVPENLPSDQELEVGTVAMVVSRSQPFVLIRTHTNMALPERAHLLSLSPEGTTATLRLSSEKRKDYLVADLIEGRALLGDKVVLPYPGSTSARRMQPSESAQPSMMTANPNFMGEVDKDLLQNREDLPEWASEHPTLQPGPVEIAEEAPDEATFSPRFGETQIRTTNASDQPLEGAPEQEWETPVSETPFMRPLDVE